MTTQFDTTDARTLKAFRLAMTHATWVRCRDKVTGKPLAFGIESASRPGLFHLVTLQTCDCEDHRRGNYCYHRRAVRLVVDAKKAAAQAA